MAITRAQIARQLLAEGGVSLDDAKMMAPPGEFLAYINPKEADMLRAAGGSGIMTPMGIPSFVDFGGSGTGYGSAADTFSAASGNPGADSRSNVGGNGDSDGDGNEGVRTQDVFPNIANVGAKNLRRVSITPSGQTDTFRFSSPFVATAKALDRGLRNVFKTDRKNLELRTNFLRDKGVIGPGEEDEKYSDEFLLSDAGLDMLRGMGYRTIDDMTKGSDDSTPTLFRQKLVPVPETTEPEKTDLEKIIADAGDFRFLLPERFKLEEGGSVPRQAYGLGSIVKSVTKPFKKATRAIKKIAKSPLGRLAITAGLGYLATAGLGSVGSGATGTGRFKFDMFKKGLTKINPLTYVGDSATSEVAKQVAKKTTEEAAKSTLLRDLALITAPSVFAGILAKKDIEDEDIDAAIAKAREDDSGLPELLAQFDDFRFVVPEDYRQSAAEGGMMDLGGNEMDLRGGGFVPIGREEKADDVPARLSKNEFVFTADAVRAAGGGSVDKGADLMYKTMKQLENKVA